MAEPKQNASSCDSSPPFAGNVVAPIIPDAADKVIINEVGTINVEIQISSPAETGADVSPANTNNIEPFVTLPTSMSAVGAQQDAQTNVPTISSSLSSEITKEGLLYSDASNDVVKVQTRSRILHFSDGTLEVTTSDEEDDSKELVKAPVIDPKTLRWLPYMWYYTTYAASKTLSACDYLGERLAYFFGITSPKYQYAVSEYNLNSRMAESRHQSLMLENKAWRHGEDPQGSFELVVNQPHSTIDQTGASTSSSKP